MEQWKDIEGYEGLYQISDKGNVKSTPRQGTSPKSYLSHHTPKDGYPEVYLCKDGKKKNKSIHRLIAIAFLPLVEGKNHINHIDGDKTNFSLSNLEWCTHLENMRHAFKIGLINRSPETYDNRRFEVINILTGESYKDLKHLCKEKGLNHSTMRCYLTGHRTNKTPYRYAD